MVLRRVLLTVALLASVVVAVPMGAQASIALPDREITITIEKVLAVNNFGSSTFPEAADFYGVVAVAGVELPRSATVHDNDDIAPNWVFRTTVDRSIGTVPVQIRIFDEDGGLRFGDDEADLGPGPGRALDLAVAVAPCSVGGEVSGACGTSLVSVGTVEPKAQITFKIEVAERQVSADVSVLIQRVRALDDFGGVIGEAADFYAVVSIDGVELPESPVVDDDDDISPNWEFKRLVPVTATAVPIWIEIYDQDGFLRGDDDQADIVPGGNRRLDLTLDLTTCTISGELSSSCGTVIVSAGSASPRAEITFVIDAVPPPAAEDLRIRCTHTPVWPQPGETVTITADFLDDELNALVADRLEIYVDNRTAPAASTTTASTLTHTFTASTGTFFYGCGGERVGLKVFSGYRRTTMGTPAGTTNAVPIHLTGEPGQRIDVVFIPDGTSFTGAADPAFQTMVSDWITTELFVRDVFLVNQDLINLWIGRDTGTAGGVMGNSCTNQAPPGFTTTYGFAEAVGLLHTRGIRDCAQGRLFSSDTLPTLTHEMGHTPFGLPDEYCCDGGYWQPEVLPSVYESQAACQSDAPNVGRAASACRSWTSTRNNKSYWTSDPATGDLMVDNTTEQALDIRRITWVLNDAGRTTEGPGGAGEPASAPIPPLLTAPTSKAYRLTGQVDANGTSTLAVELITTYPRYVGDEPDELRVGLATWTGRDLGAIAKHSPFEVHAYDQTTGRPAGSFESDTAPLDVMIPFNPKLVTIDLVDADGTALGSIRLDEAIRTYCSANPLDPDCAQGYDLLVHDVSVDAVVGIVGDPVPVGVVTDVRNAGPTATAAAVLEVRAAATGPVTVAPPSLGASADVTTGAPWLHPSTFDATCTDAGTGTVTIESEVEPGADDRLELDPRNDVGTGSAEIECILPVAINIRPGQLPNRMNAGSGTVHVAVLTTAAGEYGLPLAFDAAWIDESSLVLASRSDALAGTGSPARRDSMMRDEPELSDERTRDTDLDLRVFFTSSLTGLTPASTEGCVVGRFERPDGTGGRFIGCDSVLVVP